MNNLTQRQKDAKASYLQRQLEQTIETYKAATNRERSTTIRHIDSFLKTLSEDGKLSGSSSGKGSNE